MKSDVHACTRTLYQSVCVQGKSVPVMCLEGFHDLLQTVALKFPGKMEGFLGSVNPAVEEGAGRSETVHFFIRHFQVGGRE